MHIYSHHALVAVLGAALVLISALVMVFNKRAAEQSGGWFRWMYLAIAGYGLCACARNLIIATVLLTARPNMAAHYLAIASFVCSITMVVMLILGTSYKQRQAKLGLQTVTETPVVDAWPPAPKPE